MLFCSLGIAISQSETSLQFLEVNEGVSNNWISSISQDRQGFIWVGTQDGLNRFDGYKFEIQRNSPEKKNTLSANFVREIVMDTLENNFWITTQGGGLNKFSINEMTFKEFSKNNETNFSCYFSTYLSLLSNNQLAFICEEGVFIINCTTENILKLPFGNYSSEIESENSKLWVSIGASLICYDVVKKKIIDEQIFDGPIQFIKLVEKGQVLVSTENKLYLLSENNIKKEISIPEGIITGTNYINGMGYLASVNKIYNYSLNPFEINETETMLDFSEKLINTLFLDRQNLLWVGTKKGLYREKSYLNEFGKSIKGFFARRILIRNDTLYLGTPTGLLRFNAEKEIAPIPSAGVVTALNDFGNEIWFGMGNGRVVILKEKGVLKNTSLSPGLKYGRVYGLEKDNQGRVWASSWSGLHLLDKEGVILKSFKLNTASVNGEAKIVQMLIDKKDRLWIITAAYGVFKIDHISSYTLGNENLPMKQYLFDENNKNSITSDVIISLTEDLNGTIWFGTDIGVVKYNEESNDFTRLRYNNELFDQKVMTVRNDADNNLWITTIDDGIYVYSQTEKTISHYTIQDGLLSNAFLFGSGFYDAFNNRFYFGTDAGVQQIDLNSFEKRKKLTKPAITEFKINTNAPRDQLSAFQSPFLKEVTLDFKQNDFTVSFSALDFATPEKINYAYSLDDVPWKITDLQTAYFTNVPYGKHTLKVKSIFDAEEVDQESPVTTLVIEIKPPWYLSWWAYIVYSILILSLLSFIYYLLLKRKLAMAEAEKTKELEEVKSKMYADISHEFRTPLTLINGLTNRLLKKNLTTTQQANTIDGIKNSNDQLLNLINQMLDLVSLDNNQMDVHYKKGDVVTFVKKCVALYKSFADSKNQKLLFTTELKTLYMDIDDDKLQKIINNLLSNAVKFTQEKGIIEVNLLRKKNSVILKITDTGKGIKPEELPRVFDRYFTTFDLKNKLGTGIGMALTKELVLLLKGDIEVESEQVKGTCFTVQLPIQNTSTEKTPLVHAMPFVEVSSTNDPTQQNISESFENTILIVEDNIEVRNYISQLLGNLYKIIVAKDGEEGLKIAKEKTIDFIVSDVMMPVMDGFEFCKNIKNDINTSHIPFIMVTAKTETHHKLKGYQLGVDAYLSKPFNEEELFLIIKNLLYKKEEQIDYFSRLLHLQKTHKKEKDINALDVDFIKNIQEFALDKDNKTSMDDLARMLFTSRTQIHRKIKLLTGMSTTLYINHIRIEKAKELLKNTTLNVSEIGYEVGFDNANYFSKVFKNQQGITPSVYRENTING